MRPVWDDVWMDVADSISQRSRCVRRYGAVIITPEDRVVATGFNGPPATLDVVGESCTAFCPHACRPVGEGAGYADCFAIHAEANALLFCDRREREAGTIYVTGIPCLDCAKLISNSGLRRVVFRDDQATYRGFDQVMELLTRCGLEPKIMASA